MDLPGGGKVRARDFDVVVLEDFDFVLADVRSWGFNRPC